MSTPLCGDARRRAPSFCAPPGSDDQPGRRLLAERVPGALRERDRDRLRRNRRRARIVMLRLPLRERESRLLGEHRVHRTGIVTGGGEDPLELEHVVAAITDAERAEEPHRRPAPRSRRVRRSRTACRRRVPSSRPSTYTRADPALRHRSDLAQLLTRQRAGQRHGVLQRAPLDVGEDDQILLLRRNRCRPIARRRRRRPRPPAPGPRSRPTPSCCPPSTARSCRRRLGNLLGRLGSALLHVTARHDVLARGRREVRRLLATARRPR